MEKCLGARHVPGSVRLLTADIIFLSDGLSRLCFDRDDGERGDRGRNGNLFYICIICI